MHSRTSIRSPAEVWLSSVGETYDVVIAEIVLYEVRRELRRLDRSGSVARLDRMAANMFYGEITTEIMLRASELWAQTRRRGRPTADDKALDIDVILAATALALAAEQDEHVIVATSNVGHLAQFVDARPWQTITP